MCVCLLICMFMYILAILILIILCTIDSLCVRNYIFVFESVCDNSYFIVVNK